MIDERTVRHDEEPSPQQTLLQKSYTTFVEIREKAKSLVIDSTEKLQEAANSITIAKRIAKVVDEHREQEKKPHFDAAKEVDELHMPLIKDCKALADELEAKSRAYRRQLEQEAERQRQEAFRKQAEAEAAARAEAQRLEAEREKRAKKNEKKNLPPPPPIQAPTVPAFIPPPSVEIPKAVSTTFGTVKLDKKYDYDIVNIAIVPLHLIQVNDKAVRETIKQGKREIPGLRIFEI